MAEPSDLSGEVITALELVNSVPVDPATAVVDRKKEQAARRTSAVAWRLAGLTYEQIGERLGIAPDSASALVERTLSRAESGVVEQMRQEEGARLDRVQAAIWQRALEGDYKAIDSFLKISAARRRLYGLDQPTKIDISIGVREEMEQALAQLENVILGEVLSDSAPQ